MAGIEHDDQLVGLAAERFGILGEFAIDDDLAIPGQQSLDAAACIRVPPACAVSGKVHEDAPALRRPRGELAEFGDDAILGGLLVEELRDIARRYAHGHSDFLGTVEIVRYAEQWRDFLITVDRDTDDQCVLEGLLSGCPCSRGQHARHQQQDRNPS